MDNKFTNVTRIDLPEATYSILYGMHIIEQNSDELPEDVDYLLLETGMHEYLKDPEYTINRLGNHVQYKALFRKAEKHQIPIVFADLKYRFNDFALLFLDNAASAAAWFAGTKLLKKTTLEVRKGNYKSALVTGLIGGWLVIPFAVNAIRLGSSFSRIGEKETNRLKRFSHKIHPETEILYLTLRNAVIAEKAKTLAKNHKGRPHIAIVLGAGHVGIEDMLTVTQKRMEKITRFGKLLQKLANPEYLYTTLISDKKGKSWNFTRIITPNLESLIA